MDAFNMKIAGLTACIQPLFASTREYFRSYLVDLDPEFFIDVAESDLRYEQEQLDLEALEEGLRFRKFSDPFLERATIQRKVAAKLLTRDTILMHGSTIGVDGAAYLFTAPCGTGKSTHTRYYREAFGDRTVMINDDKAFLQITPAGVLAYGSPWSGKHGLDTNICLPLKGICFLQRGIENRILQAERESCLCELLHQCFVPEEKGGSENAFALIHALSGSVPLWKMECTKSSEAARISYNAMSNYQQL